VTALTLLSVSLGGCAAALVGGLIYKSTKSNEEKATFVTNLQKTNLEREKVHLKPLDWCSEGCLAWIENKARHRDRARNTRFETSWINRYRGAAHHARCGVSMRGILLSQFDKN
jgi:hypothetical protein